MGRGRQGSRGLLGSIGGHGRCVAEEAVVTLRVTRVSLAPVGGGSGSALRHVEMEYAQTLDKQRTVYRMGC